VNTFPKLSLTFFEKKMTSNEGIRKRKAKYAVPQAGMRMLSKVVKKAKEATMGAIVKLLDNEAAKNGGRVPKGLVPKVIQQFSIVAPGLTRDKINHYRKAHKKGHKRGATGSLLSQTTGATENLLQEDSEDDPAKERRLQGGRPKGTTMKASQEELESYQKASAEAAQEYKKALDGNTGKRRMKKGLLAHIIMDAKKRHNVEHLEIPEETIRSRLKRGSLNPSHRGTVSPMTGRVICKTSNKQKSNCGKGLEPPQPRTLGTSRDHGHKKTDTNSRKPTKFTRSNHS
jgi:DNA-directed RNA polymerase specialized sigma24 family protein